MIDDLVEDGYDLEDIIDVVDYFSDKYEDNLKKIYEALQNSESEKSDLYDYIEEYGVENLKYYEDYTDLLDDWDEDAVEAYISSHSIADLDNFEEAYYGHFDTTKDFVLDYIERYDVEIPDWISVDYERTLKSSLSDDFVEEDGYYFRRM